MSEDSPPQGRSNIAPVLQAALQVLLDHSQGVHDVRNELALIKASQRLGDVSRGSVKIDVAPTFERLEINLTDLNAAWLKEMKDRDYTATDLTNEALHIYRKIRESVEGGGYVKVSAMDLIGPRR